MECACVYVDLSDADFGSVKQRTTEEPKAIILLTCCECKETIEIGEIFRKEKTEFLDLSVINQITCMACVSIRDTFFCDGWYYEMMFEYLKEHINEMGGEISEDCIVQLTPKARDKVCEIIEDYWRYEND